MWREFTKVDQDPQDDLEIEIETDRDGASVRNIRNGRSYMTIYNYQDHATPMVGILPSGQITDSVATPGCDPYFVVTMNSDKKGGGGGFCDVITDGEKYAWVKNEADGYSHGHSHYINERCTLLKGEHPYHCDLTTRDARIIRALIKAHLESNNVV